MSKTRKRINRRDFLRDAGALLFAGSNLEPSFANGRSIWSTSIPAPSLVPEQPAKTPNYWCTWGAQSSTVKPGDAGGQLAAGNNLTETLLFKDPGWLTNYFQKVRKDLYVVYDGGWDVPIGVDWTGNKSWRLGSFELAVDRFPSCTGTPVERLRKLNEMTKAAGWRGAGVWVAAQDYEDNKDGHLLSHARMVEDLSAHARWSRDAGIEYWKCDYGARGIDPNFRKEMTDLCRNIYPELVVEHARTSGPLNDESCPWDTIPRVVHHSGRFAIWDNGHVLDEARELLTFSSVLRTYDVVQQLRIVSTLDRVADLVAQKPSSAAGDGGLLLCEDQVEIGAGLGCAFGIMRSAVARTQTGPLDDPSDAKHRIDAVARAVRWQRIAPAFPAWEAEAHLDDRALMDDWVFEKGHAGAGWLAGRDTRQGAPARVSRGMKLPTVKTEGDSPFVVAARYPQGAISVATLFRVTPKRGCYLPLVDVAIDAGEGNTPVGIFGRYKSLTLWLSHDLGARRIWAQDLAGDSALDVTSRVAKQGKSLILSGGLIDEVGRAAASPGDISNPGLVLRLI